MCVTLFHRIEFRSYKLYLYTNEASFDEYLNFGSNYITRTNNFVMYIESFLNNSRFTITNCYLTFFLRVKILNKNTWRERLDYMRVKIPRLNSIFIITE